MIESCFVVDGFPELQSFTQVVPQYRIDQARVFRAAQESRCFDRSRDCRMIGYAGIAQLEQADGQQGFDDAVACLERPVQQSLQVCAQSKMVTQCSIAQHIDQRPVSRIYVLFMLIEDSIQRTAMNDYGVHRFRCFRAQAGGCFGLVHKFSDQALATKVLLAGELCCGDASPAGPLNFVYL